MAERIRDLGLCQTGLMSLYLPCIYVNAKWAGVERIYVPPNRGFLMASSQNWELTQKQRPKHDLLNIGKTT